MKLKAIASALLVSLSLSGCVIHVGKSHAADVEFKEELTLNADSINQLLVENGSGSINIIGVEGQTSINVKAHVWTDDDRSHKLSLTQSGDEARLVAYASNSFGSWGSSNTKIDIDVTMPKHLALSISDGSGSINVESIGSDLDIDDGSGSIELSDVVGSVKVNDGSGNLTIEKVSNNLDITDGSGNINIRDIGGDVVVNDGSGDLSIQNIKGGVDVDDGSGSLSIKNVDGFTKVLDDSGNLSIKNIMNKVYIEDGSGDITVKNTKGLEINGSGSGQLYIKEINGPVSLDD